MQEKNLIYAAVANNMWVCIRRAMETAWKGGKKRHAGNGFFVLITAILKGKPQTW
ncbi:MAG TPA: hypothetical protein VMW24_10735 [Sedimentisphaerales bacterium]|nr:hypothetical protein [Sedimentisphaerales bacterium]